MFRPAWTRPRGRRRGIVVACLVAVGVASSQRDSEAYRLYDNGALDYIVPASEAIRWSPDVWGSGGTLSWEIEDSPDWPLLQDHLTDDFETFVQEALSRWAGVAAADISWRLTGFRGRTDGPRFGNGRHQVFFEADSGSAGPLPGGSGTTRARLGKSRSAMSGWVESGWTGSKTEQRTRRRWNAGCKAFWLRNSDTVLAWGKRHRFRRRGCCAHPSMNSTGTALRSGPPPPPWDGGRPNSPKTTVSAPRCFGRAPGWLSGAGSLAGMLQSEGEPVPYAHVFALRGGPDGLRDPVGAFTNADGEFLIEGLPPCESRQRLGSLDGRGGPGAARPGVGAPGGRRSPPGPNRCVQ